MVRFPNWEWIENVLLRLAHDQPRESPSTPNFLSHGKSSQILVNILIKAIIQNKKLICIT